ncbi:MAG TPA: arylsulfotransferase family protein [Solirubrobacteraceae bacterium]|jgi:hypothetical protein
MQTTSLRPSRLIASLAAAIATSLLAGPGQALAAASSPQTPASSVAPVTISPLPGTPDASPKTQISFLGIPESEISDVSVVGSSSGSHSGHLEAYASAHGASFLPSKGFVQGEHVTVSAMVGPSGQRRRVSSYFTVARLFHYAFPPPSARPSSDADDQSFVSAPGVQTPTVDVTVHSPKASPGDIFFGSNSGSAAWGPTIINEKGQLVWFHEVPQGDHAMDFKVAEYEGKPVLVWWQGYIPPIGLGFGEDEIYNDSYQHVATIKAGNGYQADLHEVLLRPQGSAFITAYSLVDADTVAEGGFNNGGLADAVLQEVDVKTGLVMFEWHAYGHVPLNESYSKASSSHGWPFDFFHMNSVSMDPSGDGNFLISSRNMRAGYEINHLTGQILWHLGGKKSSFTMGPGTRTAYQHDIQWQPDHTITIFDNGGSPPIHKESRALRERIDFKTKAVQLVSVFNHQPPLSAESQGDVQVLSDGDTFVGWGQEPFFSEFGPKGEVLFSAHLPTGSSSYRAFRFPWSGTPSEPPRVAIQSGSGGALNVFASWNGATAVSSWRVLGGASKGHLGEIATTPLTSFQTETAVHTKDTLLAVQALGKSGEVLGTSATAKR